MRTLENLFFVGYDLTQGSDLYASYGFCLTARESKLCIDYCTESAGSPFINLGLLLTKEQASRVDNGFPDKEDLLLFIRSNFTPSQIETILKQGYDFAKELNINLENEARKERLFLSICKFLPGIAMQEGGEEHFLEDYANGLINPPFPFFAFLSEGKESFPFLIIPDYEKEGNTAFRLNLETGNFTLSAFSNFTTLYPVNGEPARSISDFYPLIEKHFAKTIDYFYEGQINEEDFISFLPYFAYYVKTYVPNS